MSTTPFPNDSRCREAGHITSSTSCWKACSSPVSNATYCGNIGHATSLTPCFSSNVSCSRRKTGHPTSWIRLLKPVSERTVSCCRDTCQATPSIVWLNELPNVSCLRDAGTNNADNRLVEGSPKQSLLKRTRLRVLLNG